MPRQPTIEDIIPQLMVLAEDLRCFGKWNSDRTTNALAANLENWALQRCIARVRAETPDIEDSDLVINAHELMRTLSKPPEKATYEIED